MLENQKAKLGSKNTPSIGTLSLQTIFLLLTKCQFLLTLLFGSFLWTTPNKLREVSTDIKTRRKFPWQIFEICIFSNLQVAQRAGKRNLELHIPNKTNSRTDADGPVEDFKAALFEYIFQNYEVSAQEISKGSMWFRIIRSEVHIGRNENELRLPVWIRMT